MHILMLDNELPPLGGGMGTANLALLHQLAEIDEMHVDVVTAALGGSPETEDFSERIRIYKVPVWNRNIHHSSNRELILYTIQAFFLALRLVRQNQYDFCFAWSAVPAGAVALGIHQLTGLPYLLWVSGPDIPGFEQRYVRIYPILTPLLRRIWKKATPLIAKCPEEIDLIHKTLPGQPVTLIPNGVDITAFTPHFPVYDPDINRPLQVICVARLIERKGQHHLIQAAAQLAQQGIRIDVHLIGTGDSLDAFRALASQLGVSDQIHFVGYVARENLSAYLTKADVFVLASFYEGMSLAALEGLSAGLPVILSRTGGTDDLVQDGENGFTFAWADVNALAAHLKWMHAHRHVLADFGRASRKRAEQYSWPAITEQYLSIFKDLTQSELPG